MQRKGGRNMDAENHKRREQIEADRTARRVTERSSKLVACTPGAVRDGNKQERECDRQNGRIRADAVSESCQAPVAAGLEGIHG